MEYPKTYAEALEAARACPPLTDAEAIPWVNTLNEIHALPVTYNCPASER